MKETKGFFCSSLVSNSGSTCEGAHAREFGEMKKVETALSSGVRSSTFQSIRKTSSAGSSVTLACWTILYSISDGLSRYRASLQSTWEKCKNSSLSALG